MAIPLEGLRALKGKETGSALKNDLYVRRWTSTKGKGKDKKVVEHEAHFNAVGLLVGVAAGVAAAGAAVIAGSLALRMGGKKLVLGKATRYFVVDDFGAASHMVTIVDVPASSYIKIDHLGVPHTIIVPAVTHEERIWDTPEVSALLTKRGILLGAYKGPSGRIDAVNAATKRQGKALPGTVELIREQDVIALNPLTRRREHAYRWFYKYKVEGLGLEDKEDESWISKMFGIG